MITEFNADDEVVFRQVAPDGNPEDLDVTVKIIDGTAYQIHHGVVNEVEETGGEVLLHTVWDDGVETATQAQKVSHPDDVDWYDNE